MTRHGSTVIEFDGGAWIVLHDNGDVRAYRSARAALLAVSRRAERDNETITITRIQWRNTPEGFVPPTAGGAR